MEGCLKVVQRDDSDFVVVMGDVLDRHDDMKMSHLYLA